MAINSLLDIKLREINRGYDKSIYNYKDLKSDEIDEILEKFVGNLLSDIFGIFNQRFQFKKRLNLKNQIFNIKIIQEFINKISFLNHYINTFDQENIDMMTFVEEIFSYIISFFAYQHFLEEGEKNVEFDYIRITDDLMLLYKKSPENRKLDTPSFFCIYWLQYIILSYLYSITQLSLNVNDYFKCDKEEAVLRITSCDSYEILIRFKNNPPKILIDLTSTIEEKNLYAQSLLAELINIEKSINNTIDSLSTSIKRFADYPDDIIKNFKNEIFDWWDSLINNDEAQIQLYEFKPLLKTLSTLSTLLNEYEIHDFEGVKKRSDKTMNIWKRLNRKNPPDKILNLFKEAYNEIDEIFDTVYREKKRIYRNAPIAPLPDDLKKIAEEIFDNYPKKYHYLMKDDLKLFLFTGTENARRDTRYRVLAQVKERNDINYYSVKTILDLIESR